MFCGKCGHRLPSSDNAFCTQCGAKVMSVEPLSSDTEKMMMQNVEKSDKSASGILARWDAMLAKQGKGYAISGIAIVLAVIAVVIIATNRDTREGVIIRNIELIVSPIYHTVLDFSEERAAVRYGDRWGFIDLDGNEVIAPKYSWVESFSYGLAAVSDGYLWGFIDAAGNEVIPLAFDEAMPFAEGLAAVRVGDWETGLWGFIDTRGNMVIQPGFSFVESFSEGLAVVSVGDWETGLMGFIDTAGNEVIPLRYEGAMSFSEGLAAVGDVNRVWFIDTLGNEIFSLKYDIDELSVVRRFSDGLVAIQVGDWETGLWGFIDISGNEVIPPRYNRVGCFSDGLAVVQDGYSWGFIDTSGNRVFWQWSFPIEPFSSGLTVVEEWRQGESLHWFINTYGETFSIDLDVDIRSLGSVNYGMVAVQVGSAWGFLRVDT